MSLTINADGTVVQPVSGTVTANIGTSGSLALNSTLTDGTARSQITDGTNNAAVKAASTAPLATDPALVVSISPNSPISVSLPVGGATSALQTVGNSSLSNIENAMPFLNRIAKNTESLNTVDSANRLRATIDSIAAGVTLPTVTAVTTVSTVTTVGTVSDQTKLAGMDREMFINISRQTYAACIRAKLT